MVEENISQEYRLKNVDETKNYFVEEIILNTLILASIVTVSISALGSLFSILIWIASSAIRLRICTITAQIRKYKSITKKKQNKHKIKFLAKTKLNSIEVVISKALINSNIIHNEFVLINNVLKEYDDVKEEINNFKTS